MKFGRTKKLLNKREKIKNAMDKSANTHDKRKKSKRKNKYSFFRAFTAWISKVFPLIKFWFSFFVKQWFFAFAFYFALTFLPQNLPQKL